jgi:hypothetical protein
MTENFKPQIINLLELELPESPHARNGHRFLRAAIGLDAGATLTGAS